MAKFVARPENAELTRKLVAVLVGVNDEINDGTLSKMVEQPLTPRTYPLKAAFRDLERGDPPIHFRRIRNLGWKRLHDPDLVAHSETDLKKITRGARRGRKRLNHVQFENLSAPQQMQCARNNTRFMMIEQTANVVQPAKGLSTIPDLNDLIRKVKEQGQ
jgi:hypothetical protein